MTTDHNPYASPTAVNDARVVASRRLRSPWLIRLIALQVVVIIVSLAVEAYEHETIVGSGPVFSVLGFIIAAVAIRQRDRAAAIFGFSAFAFSLLIVFLINYNGWGPPQGDRPITILAYLYTLIALPAAIRLVVSNRQ